MITITPSAITYLRALMKEKEASETDGLRLLVQRGGCAGMQYSMKIDASTGDDFVLEKEDVRVLVDPESMEFLKGCELDYEDSLNDSGFKINNPNAARSCGCGTSFEPAEVGKTAEYDSSMDGAVCGGSETEENAAEAGELAKPSAG